MNRTLPALALIALLASCGPGQQSHAPADPASADPATAGPGPAQPPAPPVAGIDPARLANPCLLEAKAVSAALGFAVEQAEPSVMGALAGCTYRGKDASLQLNFITHEPVYFDQATRATRATRPGDKRDLPGDPDKAWIQQEGSQAPILHYYRQNVEVELVPLLGAGSDARKIEAALLGLPRVP